VLSKKLQAAPSDAARDLMMNRRKFKPDKLMDITLQAAPDLSAAASCAST
jgi:hypothetical protein